MKLTTEKKIQIINKVWSLLGWTMQKYQLDLVMDESKRIIVLKARGVGVSIAIAWKMLLKSLEVKGEYIIVSQDKANAEHILKYISDFYEVLKNSPLKEVLPKVLYYGKDYFAFSNGSSIYCKSSEPNSVRGLHGMTAWDETAFTFNDTDMRKAVNGCLRPNFQEILFSSPNEQSGVFYETWDKGKSIEDGGVWKKYFIPYTECTIDGYKEAVETDKKQALEEGWIDDWKQEYMCQFIDQSSRLFTYEFISSHIEKSHLEVPPEFGGMDFGKKVDNSVYHGLIKDMAGIVRVCKTIDFDLGLDYALQLDTIVANIKYNKDFRGLYVDSTGVGVKLLEDLSYTDIGYMVNGVSFTNAIKEKMVMYLYSLMSGDKILLPNDKTLLKQMHGIKRSKTDTGMTRYKHEDGKHDDSFWALCLALNGYMNEKDSAKDIKVLNIGENRYNKFKRSFSIMGRKGGRDLWNT